jgi:copper chaperone
MTQAKLYPSWTEMLVSGTNGPTHQTLIETDGFKAVLVSLEAGKGIPPHPAAAAAYHFLKGSGWMIVDGKRFAVEPGATVVVPAGVLRGVEAETSLSFLGSHGAAPKENKRPWMKMSLPLMLGGVLMLGLMIGGMILPAQMMARIGSPGLGMWGVMALPILGMGVMMGIMFIFYRRMAGAAVMPAMMAGHSHHMQAQSHPAGVDKAASLTFNLPSVNCGHCKMTVERAVSEIKGVDSIQVDVENKQARVRFGSPATRSEIEAVLTEIGYPPAE